MTRSGTDPEERFKANEKVVKTKNGGMNNLRINPGAGNSAPGFFSSYLPDK